MKRSKTLMLQTLFLFISAIFSALNLVNGSVEPIRKLGETPVSTTDQGGDEKCTPCIQSPPPPPPPSPCPPPPSPPPPPKKPPSPPSSTSQYCPPPPAPFIYITGPPGQQLYPLDSDFNDNGAAKSGSITATLPILIACGIGLLGVLNF